MEWEPVRDVGLKLPDVEGSTSWARRPARCAGAWKLAQDRR